MRQHPLTRLFALLLLALPGAARGGAPDLTTAPVRWRDPDDRPVPPPTQVEENQVWDIVDHTFFYPVGRLLDLGVAARRLGTLLHVAPRRQADNANALDEVPSSSWFTNRHFLYPLTLEELRRGPGEAAPDQGGPWEVVAGKFEGGTAGFTIRDAAGVLYLLKFDSPGNNEMGSAAEAIATRVLHAAGYHVPRNCVVYFDPGLLVIGQAARVPAPGGRKRPMTPADLQGILAQIPPQPDGRLRCLASQFLPGVPVGVFDYHGRRADDPNDRVDHEHRRELRGLRVIAAWMNDADRRAANTLCMFVPDSTGKGHVRHYLIDMGSTFGSNNLEPHRPKYGNEYVWDPRTIFLGLVTLGLYREPWEEPLPMPYPELGYFENETFDPGRWVPTYPNPAFAACTPRDAYWGAKIVTSFTDADIQAMVSEGRYTNPEAAALLARLLAKRRDLIGRYWFARLNPLDRFSVEGGILGFADLAVEAGLASEGETTYRVGLLDGRGRAVGPARALEPTDLAPAGVDLVAAAAGDRDHRPRPAQPRDARGTGRPGPMLSLPLPDTLAAGNFHGVEVRTRRGRGGWSRYTRVYFYRWPDDRWQLVRVEREE
ncbi:MAG: hypothetical protein AB1505_09525 [Candidatus Latescibacterota bacterium]